MKWPHRSTQTFALSALALTTLAGLTAARQAPTAPGAGSATAAVAPADAHAADEAAIKALNEAFIQAFNAGDADALAAQYAEDARSVATDGTALVGRAAIRDRFAQRFADVPGWTVTLETESLHFPTDGVAIEEGAALATPPEGSGEPVRASHVIVYARKDGQWKVAEVRDRDEEEVVDATGRDEGDRALEALGWMVGDWIDQDDRATVYTSCAWSEDGKYLLRSFNVQVKGQAPQTGQQRIGWDPVHRQIRSWSFDAEGGFTDGLWTETEPGTWVIKTTGFVRDGRTVSTTNTLRRDGSDRFFWGASDRIVGSDYLPDYEQFVIARRPPEPDAVEAPAAAPATAEPPK